MSAKRMQYSIVVPVYNSADIVEELVNQVKSVMKARGYSFELILVDDGSIDTVWKKITGLAATHSFIRGLRLSNNFGQWMATTAGMSRARGEHIITMDDDLEYDPADIITLIENYSKGDYYLIFGLAKDKYRLQGKPSLIALWRSRLVNVIWQKFLTDSFKLFSRELVFDEDKFIPNVHFEAFVNVTLAPSHVGYCEHAFITG
ncbi:unnamed protein product [Sphagnum jensenii]|uniref:Glycosyltransferase 2-like domain-containing protein n=1 Tax=Sphagnum jensenii TaxID=128206 RepID=A0ABP0V8W2_9BRYO